MDKLTHKQVIDMIMQTKILPGDKPFSKEGISVLLGNKPAWLLGDVIVGKSFLKVVSSSELFLKNFMLIAVGADNFVHPKYLFCRKNVDLSLYPHKVEILPNGDLYYKFDDFHSALGHLLGYPPIAVDTFKESLVSIERFVGVNWRDTISFRCREDLVFEAVKYLDDKAKEDEMNISHSNEVRITLPFWVKLESGKWAGNRLNVGISVYESIGFLGMREQIKDDYPLGVSFLPR